MLGRAFSPAFILDTAVLGPSDCLQVVGVNARSILTDVVKLVTWRDWSAVSFEYDSMRTLRNAINLDNAVASDAKCSLPNPAACHFIDSIFNARLSPVVMSPIRHRFTFDPATRRPGVGRGVRRFAATTLTKARRIGWNHDSAGRPIVMKPITVPLTLPPTCRLVVSNGTSYGQAATACAKRRFGGVNGCLLHEVSIPN